MHRMQNTSEANASPTANGESEPSTQSMDSEMAKPETAAPEPAKNEAAMADKENGDDEEEEEATTTTTTEAPTTQARKKAIIYSKF